MELVTNLVMADVPRKENLDKDEVYAKGRGVPKDYAEAAKWRRKAAEQGHAQSQFMLGSMYERGSGVPEDDVEAVKWYRKAAEQGFAAAQTLLGVMYYYGKGVRKDYAAAMKWWRMAAEQGYAGGQFELGGMYAKGAGVPQDRNEAVKWYTKAAEQGHKDAKIALTALIISDSPEEVLPKPRTTNSYGDHGVSADDVMSVLKTIGLFATIVLAESISQKLQSAGGQNSGYSSSNRNSGNAFPSTCGRCYGQGTILTPSRYVTLCSRCNGSGNALRGY